MISQPSIATNCLNKKQLGEKHPLAYSVGQISVLPASLIYGPHRHLQKMNGQPPNICVYLPTLRVSWRFVSGDLKIASGPPNNEFKPKSFRYTNNMAQEE